MTAPPELSVILVNFNDRLHLAGCLMALEKAAEKLSAEVILVDNHSADESPALVRDSFPWVKLVVNEANVGYARANNIGIRSSRGEFLLFLNTDTVVPPEALTSLLAEIKNRPEAAAIGPALVQGDGRFQVSFGREVDFFYELRQKLFLNPYYRRALRSTRKARTAGWLSGACLLARRCAVEAAGLFDECFFLYFEDIDLCRRLRDLSYELVYFPSVRVVHLGGATTARDPWRNRLHYREGQLYYYEKHSSGVSVFLLRFFLRLDLVRLSLFKAETAEDRTLVREARRRIFGGR
jgi:GT2 family glycosyltransferase